MLSITPCRTTISDRFPVASFVVNVPPNSPFEVACATDPRLLYPEHAGERSVANFVTSREAGLLRAAAGQATYLMPPEHLRRFAGARRLYYAAGAYGGADTEASFTIDSARPEAVPCIMLSGDFTGKTLDKTRLKGVSLDSGRYGTGTVSQAWGGDRHLSLGGAMAQPSVVSASEPYDDGFDAALWTQPERTSASRGLASEPTGFEHGPDLPNHSPTRAFGGAVGVQELAGWEDAPAARGVAPAPVTRTSSAASPSSERWTPQVASPPSAVFGGVNRMPIREIHGFEDAPALSAQPSFGMASRPPAVERAGATHHVAPRFAGGLQAEVPHARFPERAETASSPLDVSARLRLIEWVARFESGDAGYGALTTSPGEAGLSWGLLAFDQRSGALGELLQTCRRRDPTAFGRAFGEHAERLLETTTASSADQRMALVGGVPLWEEPWLARFREASTVQAFQEAQREAADRYYFLPNLDLAASFALDTGRALAVILDRCVQMGNPLAREWIVSTASPISSRARMEALLAEIGQPDLRAFQAAVGLPATGDWDLQTHLALLKSLPDSSRLGWGRPDASAFIDRLQAEANARAQAEGAPWDNAAERINSIRVATGEPILDSRFVLDEG